MTRRYFVPDLPLRGGQVSLSKTESQHATRVMRVQIGEIVTLFDGQGHESAAAVVAIDRQACHCEAKPAVAKNRESTRELELAIALPKPDRARELIERLTELGVSRVVPLVANRTQRPPSASLIDKLGRAIVEASKQCGRNRLMQLDPTAPAEAYFAQRAAGGNEPPTTCWIAHPGGDRWQDVVDQVTTSAVVAIGPEGGWSEQELAVARQSGFTPIDLGRRIYRIETAATVIAATLAD